MATQTWNLGAHVAAVFERPSRGPSRVLLLIPCIWALNLLDLLFTLLGGLTRDFVELNPLASRMGPAGMITLKLGMLLFFTAVAIAFRRHRVTAVGCYVLLGVYAVLAVVWFSQFSFLLSPCYFHMLLCSR